MAEVANCTTEGCSNLSAATGYLGKNPKCAVCLGHIQSRFDLLAAENARLSQLLAEHEQSTQKILGRQPEQIDIESLINAGLVSDEELQHQNDIISQCNTMRNKFADLELPRKINVEERLAAEKRVERIYREQKLLEEKRNEELLQEFLKACEERGEEYQ
jgi:hypothetical protein